MLSWIGQSVLRATDYDVLITYSLAADPFVYSDTVMLPVGVPYYSVFLGGIFGAVLLVAVLSASRAIRQRHKSTDVATDLPEVNLRQAVLFAIRGGLVSVCVIFISKAVSGPTIPVSIDIRDFYGGVIVGLFSIPISEWIVGVLIKGPSA